MGRAITKSEYSDAGSRSIRKYSELMGASQARSLSRSRHHCWSGKLIHFWTVHHSKAEKHALFEQKSFDSTGCSKAVENRFARRALQNPNRVKPEPPNHGNARYKKQ